MPTKSEQKAAIAVIEEIENKIYIIRGQRIMLDNDLAEIHGVETRRLKEQVRRNLSRFPKDFMFELTTDEMQGVGSLRSQIATLNDGKSKRGRHSKYTPFAFTEHGAVMLASVLNSPTAVEASIAVVRAFVRMRAMLALHQDLADRIEELEKVTDYHGQKFGAVSALLSEIMHDPKYLKRKIGFVEGKKKKK
jgi:hypothetical protein